MTLITRTTQNDGTILVQVDGVLHNPVGPAVIRPNGTREWAKNGVLHSWGGQPSQVFANGTKRWHFEGRLTSQYRLNAEGRGAMLTQYHTNGHRATEYFEHLGVRLDYSFANGLLIRKQLPTGISYGIFEGKLCTISDAVTGTSFRLTTPMLFTSRAEAKLNDMINEFGMHKTCNILAGIIHRFETNQQRQNAIEVMTAGMIDRIFG